MPESGRNYDCDSPCTSPPSLHWSMPSPENAVKREKVTNVIGIAANHLSRSPSVAACRTLAQCRCRLHMRFPRATPRTSPSSAAPDSA